MLTTEIELLSTSHNFYSIYVCKLEIHELLIAFNKHQFLKSFIHVKGKVTAYEAVAYLQWGLVGHVPHQLSDHKIIDLLNKSS